MKKRLSCILVVVFLISTLLSCAYADRYDEEYGDGYDGFWYDDDEDEYVYTEYDQHYEAEDIYWNSDDEDYDDDYDDEHYYGYYDEDERNDDAYYYDYEVDFTLVSPKNKGTIPANRSFWIEWSDAPEVDSWRVEVYRDNVAFDYDHVYDTTKMGPYEAKWATPGSKFIVIIEPVIDREPNVRVEKFTFTVSNSRTDADTNGRTNGTNRSDSAGSGNGSGSTNKSAWTKDDLPGYWTMTEARKDANDDVIQFDVHILTVSDSGKVVLDWGDSGRIEGRWNDSLKTLKVFRDQVYVLKDGVLGGGSRNYSGIAFKTYEQYDFGAGSIIGAWRMTENRKELDDVIQFDINIIDIDGNGNVTLDWGDSGRITGKWSAWKKTLTVFDQQVYVFHDGVFAGGSGLFSGVAFPKNR